MSKKKKRLKNLKKKRREQKNMSPGREEQEERKSIKEEGQQELSQKEKENKSEDKTERRETVNVQLTGDDEIYTEGMKLSDILQEETAKKERKNCWAAVILLAGLLVGSILVDAVQFFAKKGYSPRALKSAKMFTLDGKTWVAYDEPIVKLKALAVADENELKDCPACQLPAEVLEILPRMIPTLEIEEVDINSPVGQQLAAEYKIKMIPALIFSPELAETKFFNSEARALFDKVENGKGYILNLAALGLPVGKYIETPKITAKDPVLGNKEAPLKLVLFSDYQCPYCAQFFAGLVKVAKENPDKVALIYKDFPLEFHPQATTVALTAHCAQDQNKFWEMSARLYNTQKYWNNLSADKLKSFLIQQGQRLGLKKEELEKCLTERKYEKVIKDNLRQANEFGLTGTPSLFVNRQLLAGVIPEEDLRSLITEEIKKIEAGK